MARLIYTAITSLDGYIADATGNFDWSTPDDEVHAFVNDLERPIGTYLYGRRLYEVMASWQTVTAEESPGVMADYAQLWRAADKIVYSNSLTEVSTPKTRLEHGFDPASIRTLKESTDRDLSIGGPRLASFAIEAGLVDAFGVFVNPVIVGGGTKYLPEHVRVDLELVDEHRFGNGVVYLSYRPRTS